MIRTPARPGSNEESSTLAGPPAVDPSGSPRCRSARCGASGRPRSRSRCGHAGPRRHSRTFRGTSTALGIRPTASRWESARMSTSFSPSAISACVSSGVSGSNALTPPWSRHPRCCSSPSTTTSRSRPSEREDASEPSVRRVIARRAVRTPVLVVGFRWISGASRARWRRSRVPLERSRRHRTSRSLTDQRPGRSCRLSRRSWPPRPRPGGR